MPELKQELNALDEARRLYAVQDAECADVSYLTDVLLERLLLESSALIRAAIVFRLKALASEMSFSKLFGFFRSSDAYLRNAAVGIFAGGGDKATEFLCRFTDDADREVRKLILDALFEIGTEAARSLIRQALDDPAVNVQVTAVEYLGQLDDYESGGRIVDLLGRDPDPMLTMAVLDALSRLQTKENIIKALEALTPNREYSCIDPLYLPQAMELLAICGQGFEMIQVMITLPDHALYADNIVRAATYYLKNEHSETVINQLLAKLMSLAADQSVDLEQKFMVGRLLAVHGPAYITPEKLYSLGDLLANTAVTAMIGLELIAASGHQCSVNRITTLAEKSTDPTLVQMSRELLAKVETY